jgi:hypothetical protein
MRIAGVIERYPELGFIFSAPTQHHGLMGRISLSADDITAFFHKP